jgi:hypothetical protein
MLLHLLLANVFRGGIGLLLASGISREPVIVIDGDSQRQFFLGNKLQRVFHLLLRPDIARHRSRLGQPRVLVVGHQANQVHRLRYASKS